MLKMLLQLCVLKSQLVSQGHHGIRVGLQNIAPREVNSTTNTQKRKHVLNLVKQIRTWLRVCMDRNTYLNQTLARPAPDLTYRYSSFEK